MKLVVEYDKDEKRYIISDKDKEVMQKYMTVEEFHKTTKEIENSMRLRPFDMRTPCCKRFLLKMLTIIFLIIYSYACFILLQLALFNLIMLGVMLVYFNKLFMFFAAVCFKYDYNYRNSPFQKFIEKENERFYSKKNIELIGGEQGFWLELQLPDNIEDI